ncbi:OFA family MFS transporter [Acidiphilium sp. AL]|uniref:OFA family MFS transporter n=1 Tax=Acidiphilium iwatense TaxID=768198 RepID=A0ABS9DZA2_9PROT|nr:MULTISPECIES: OFA family MFS transporter [Acidiphilium]MCF3948092.1 OFA family MFS transporter [Acidiphilium iwatense]MCU4161875.1 OFA family MFS transporter [Acidiphilium sp. AL]
MAGLGFLDREQTVAPNGYNRWLVPPAALCIHLCIGEAYAFSVFNLPLTRLIGITKHAPGDWNLVDVGWIFSVAIVFLGLSAAFTGTWLDRVGPRKAMTAAALCFGGGFLVAAFGVSIHSLLVVFLGYGVLGGIGLGIGYISPVRTLITWFPDRPGMATGLAIMGFGGGAMIAAPLSFLLMHHFTTATSLGVAPSFVALGIIYAIFMLIGALIVRVPPAGWAPAGYVAPTTQKKLISEYDVTADRAMATPQFYFLWFVLFLNVTAGIGVIGQASPMIQEMFHGRVTAATAAGFVGFLSLFNMGGRFFWASLSDWLGRKPTYFVFFLLGIALYVLVPHTALLGSVALTALCFGVILSMYGGGFSTIPAYLRDIFGVRHVGAIHGRILTAWSAAGVMGPVLVDYIRQYQIHHGVAKADAYTITLYIMAALLLVGAICNAMISPVGAQHHEAIARAAE